MVATTMDMDHETPMKMALSVAREASPDSTGKELVSFSLFHELSCIYFSLISDAN